METTTIHKMIRGAIARDMESGSRKPYYVTYTLNHHCNFKCIHCYLAHKRDCLNKAELRIDDICRILDVLSEAGCRSLTLSGGEPLLRKDIVEICAYAMSKGIVSVVLLTNGTLITDEMAAALKGIRIELVKVSLYGFSEGTWGAVTGRSEGFRECTRGIETMRKWGVPLQLRYILMKANKHEIQNAREYANKMGVPFTFNPTLVPRRDGNKAPYANMLSVDEILEFDTTDPERRTYLQEKILKIEKGQLSGDADYLYTCNAGCFYMHVDPDGKMSLCEMATQPRFDLLNGQYEEGWAAIGVMREKRRQTSSKCRCCKLFDICRPCGVLSEMEFGVGSVDLGLEYRCELTKKRYEKLCGTVPTKKA